VSEKLTSGPWILKTDLFAGGISIVGQDGFEIYHDHIGPSVSEVTRNTILANASLMAASKDMYEALKAYEAWEADLVTDNKAWQDWRTGMPITLPHLTQKLWDRLLGIQAMRNDALAKAEGKEATR